MKYSLPLLMLLLTVACSTPEKKVETALANNKFSDPEIVQIHEWKDHRQTDSLIVMLDNVNATYRAEAAMALASCQDSLAVHSLCIALDDTVALVRENAAYALGQTASIESGYSLMTLIEENPDLENPAIYWEALGSCADSILIPRILNFLNSHHLTPGASRGIYRLTLRQLSSPEFIPAMRKQIEAGEKDDLLLALHCILRNRTLDFSELDSLVAQQAGSQDPDIRIAAAGALGRMPSEYNRPVLEQLLRNPAEDVNVLISALRSYRSHDSIDAEITAAIIHHPNRDVALTACGLLTNLDKDEVWISQNIATPSNPWVEAQVLKYMPKFVVEHTDNLVAQMESQKNPYAKAAWLRALAHNPTLSSHMEKIMIDTTVERIVSTAACESLIAMFASPEWNEDQPILAFLKSGVATGDITILALISGYISEYADQLREQDDFNFLENSLENLTLPRDIETFYEIKKALASLKNETWETPKPTWNHAINWELIKSLPPFQTVTVHTNRGDYQIELDIENAPASASNFLDLIEKGYYTDKIFHRVVPNFVIQTGCPRGDGYGSVPYSIRSEFDLHDYRSGACGMASAGNDTESCQWFVTHSPTPHLEGRYSIFGYVNKGMDVVNSIHEGDTIHAITY
jgi:cyclophilin family peptidyl-prolyl cis-trans isomerase/HEAT repeat protein